MTQVRERLVLGFTVATLVAAGSAIPGCLGGDDNAAPSVDGGAIPGYDAGGIPGYDGGGSPPVGDASKGDDAAAPSDSAPPVDAGPLTQLRFAWFVGGVSAGTGGVPQVGSTGDGGLVPGHDVCVAPHGTNDWIGPLLGPAMPNGLQPFDVSNYIQPAPGQYDVRIVAAGATSCALPDAGAPGVDDAGDAAADASTGPSTVFTSLPAIVAGTSTTVVLVDPANPATSIADLFTFTDDTTTAAGKAKVRFLNVSGNDSLAANDAGGDFEGDAGTTVLGADLTLGGGIVQSSFFTNVTSQSHVDPTATNGYREIAPLSGIDATLNPTSGQNALSPLVSTDGLTLGSGQILTAFYATEAAEAGRTPVLVWCYDGVTSASNPLLTKCEHADQPSDSAVSYTRFGDFSADGDSVDVCLKYHSYGSYVGPILANVNNDDGTSIPSQFLSAYFNVHSGFAYDARFVAAGADDCSTSIADLTYTASAGGGGGYTSVLLTGYATVPADAGVPPFDAGPPGTFTDDAGPQPTSNGLTTLQKTAVAIEDINFDAPISPGIRLLHFAAQSPQPLDLVVTSDEVLGDDDGTQPANEWDLDQAPYGGFSTRPGPTDPYGYVATTEGTVQISLLGNTWTYQMGSDQTSMFAFDGDGVQLLACDDYDEEQYPGDSLYTDCCVVGGDDCGATPEVQRVPFAAKHTRRVIQLRRGR